MSIRRHKIHHKFVPYRVAPETAEVCERCLLPEELHEPPERRDRSRETRPPKIFLGIDGEGQSDLRVNGVDTAPHRYVLLAIADENGARRRHVYNPQGLSTVDCLNLILSIEKQKYMLFSYSFFYDLTKILEDLPNEELFLLTRPELRMRTDPKTGFRSPMAIRWKHYRINLLATKFSVTQRRLDGKPGWERPTVIHDIWKFYQGKFTSALEDWKVGDPAMVAHMKHMKDRRADFDKESPEKVREYCYDECMSMAQLARKLVEAHEAAGLTLKNFYGAGSSASAILHSMKIKDHLDESRAANAVPEAMREPVAAAFFGGRFENSIVGPAEGEIYSYDISSAYPYQLCFLPCLLHGKWRRTKRRADLEKKNVRAALVNYSLHAPRSKDDFTSWGPFPFRQKTGAIVFPRSSGGGWVWRDEYLSGERIFPHVGFRKAWIYECDCTCQPFREIPRYYLERLRIGKEGPGIVIKLGCNSCYGKIAQSMGGSGPFTSWVWAGLITSGTRAQILDVFALHQDMSNMLMVATDGIATRERLVATSPASEPFTGHEVAMGMPRDTGTFDGVNEKGERANKPLGGWEEKILKNGMFFARPGVYFPMNPTAEEIKHVRGRGVGRGAVLEAHRKIVDTYNEAKKGGRDAIIKATVEVTNLTRFVGAKTGISRSTSKDKKTEKFKRSPDYGRWVNRPVVMTFDPLPKRQGVSELTGELGLRSFPRVKSKPYDRGMLSDDAKLLKIQAMIADEQPDGGDYAAGQETYEEG